MSIPISQNVLPITDLKTHSRDVVKRLRESGRPVLITQRGRAAAVLESVESYEQREARYEMIEGLLHALRQAEHGELHNHRAALKILDNF